MRYTHVPWLMAGVLILGVGGARAAQDDGPPPEAPEAVDADPAAAPAAVVLPGDDPGPVKPLAEGPLHEAFLSPARDAEPARVPKSPPPPIRERPGVDRPSPRAEWIDGYWQWDGPGKDFVWVTGTWRVAPPGRFWVNGYWKRDEKGWFRVPGFWSERRTDRIDYRKDGPPADHPAEEIGEAPSPDHFYVPGQYYPDGDGVVWKPGFWAESAPGWAWVPAQWINQPEGWMFQEGYWDRTLEDRGTLFSPAEVVAAADPADVVYQPIAQIAPESYGRLYGAFGRPTTYYDGYPGCSYDPSGNYYNYAGYGSIGLYTGYLDFPYGGLGGYPYSVYPTAYSGGYGYGLGYRPFGLGGYGLGYRPFGLGGYGLGTGLVGRLLFGSLFGYGYPYYSSFGYGSAFYGGYGFGSPFLGSRYPFFGGFRRPNFQHKPFWPGGHRRWDSRPALVNRPGRDGGRPDRVGPGPGRGGPGLQRPGRVGPTPRTPPAGRPADSPLLVRTGRRGVAPPPSSAPFANPFRQSLAASRAAGPVAVGGTPNFNAGGVRPVRHTTARPALSTANPSATQPAARDPLRGRAATVPGLGITGRGPQGRVGAQPLRNVPGAVPLTSSQPRTPATPLPGRAAPNPRRPGGDLSESRALRLPEGRVAPNPRTAPAGRSPGVVRSTPAQPLRGRATPDLGAPAAGRSANIVRSAPAQPPRAIGSPAPRAAAVRPNPGIGRAVPAPNLGAGRANIGGGLPSAPRLGGGGLAPAPRIGGGGLPSAGRMGGGGFAPAPRMGGGGLGGARIGGGGFAPAPRMGGGGLGGARIGGGGAGIGGRAGGFGGGGAGIGGRAGGGGFGGGRAGGGGGVGGRAGGGGGGGGGGRR